MEKTAGGRVDDLVIIFVFVNLSCGCRKCACSFEQFCARSLFDVVSFRNVNASMVPRSDPRNSMSSIGNGRSGSLFTYFFHVFTCEFFT